MPRFTAYITPPLADARLDRIQDAFQTRKTTIDSSQIMIGLAVLALAAVVFYFVSRARERRSGRGQFDSSLSLFWSLAKAHDLAWTERWLLWRLAKCHQMKEPARLFLEPERFDSSGITASLLKKHNRLKLIARRIFAENTGDREQTEIGSRVAK